MESERTGKVPHNKKENQRFILIRLINAKPYPQVS
jgi:hypothetical protein